MTKHEVKVLRFGEDNLQSARIILEDIARYGGESAALVQWARAYFSEHGGANGATTTGRSSEEPGF
jgi:hypothetical protein